eukprot:scaffold3670_cov124-Cylindrotheca_fusiformis.AAC.4
MLYVFQERLCDNYMPGGSNWLDVDGGLYGATSSQLQFFFASDSSPLLFGRESDRKCRAYFARKFAQHLNLGHDGVATTRASRPCRVLCAHQYPVRSQGSSATRTRNKFQ